MNSGIYAIKNLINNKRYIGSTRKLNRRWQQHKNALNHQVHFNYYLQNAWNKYGESSFTYEIIENCSDDELIYREEYWIDKLNSFKDNNGYNLCKTPRASRLGCKARPETIAKMQFSLSKEKHPMWGKHLKESTKKKISIAQTGVSKPNSGRKLTFKIKDVNGIIFDINGLRKFCKDKNLSHSMLWRVLNGMQKEYKGWTVV